MMENGPVPDRAEPDNTAVRTALWRALHVLADPPPHVFEDEVGLKLVAPDDGWRERPDMSAFTRPFRASILARARFIEDLVAEQTARGIDQYVILGAGLDTFAQRRPELASRMQVFEIDQPGPQAWKRQRLMETGYGVPPYLHLVPVDFEAGDAWWDKLGSSGFDASRPAIVASAGVSMYLTRDAIMATLRRVAALTPGSTCAMTFMLPIEMLGPDIRPGVERAAAGAKASGTPFVSFFTPEEMLELPVKPVSSKHGTYRPPRSRNGILQVARTACVHRTIRKNCWWRSLDAPFRMAQDQPVQLVFTKCPGKYDRMEIMRGDGAVERVDCPKQRIIPHDMVHYAVEGTLAKRGFLARVRDDERADMRMRREAESDGVERLVEVIQGDAWSGGTSDAADIMDLYRVTCEARECPMLAITRADIDAIRKRIAELTAEWNALAVGQSLALAM